jgi:hypothetical protein
VFEIAPEFLFKDYTLALCAECRIWLPRKETAMDMDVFVHNVVFDTESIRKRGWNVTGTQNVLDYGYMSCDLSCPMTF